MTKCLWFQAELFLRSSLRSWSTYSNSLSHSLYVWGERRERGREGGGRKGGKEGEREKWRTTEKEGRKKDEKRGMEKSGFI